MIVAAGSGTRLGADVPKAFVHVGGRTLLEHALLGVLAADCVDEVVLVVPSARLALPTPAPTATMRSPHPVQMVAGGATRQQSVQRGLRALSDDVGVVLVHDAARCLTPPEVIRAVVAAVADGHRAVVPVVALRDTVRRVEGGVVDRAGLRAVQTPQGFQRHVLQQAHARVTDQADDEAMAATDDAGLVEQQGVDVHLVEGSDHAFKVTTPLDLRLVEAILADPR